MQVLVIDVGSTSVRASVVRPDASISYVAQRALERASPAPGFLELDASALASSVLGLAASAVEEAGAVDVVGIANQRGTTVVWERASGRPVGPAISWEDVRTVPLCLALAAEGIQVAPNESATKLRLLLDLADPDRTADLCFGTLDSWVAWTLSAGSAHVTDVSNAGITGLLLPDASAWDPSRLAALDIPPGVLPELVDSCGFLGTAHALPGAPMLASMVGDQQASLLGQSCTLPGLAKATFGTGGMLDVFLGDRRPGYVRRGPSGTFPIAAWRRGGTVAWGSEAIMLTAGSAVDWFVRGMGLAETPAATETLAASCEHSGGVRFVPALAGLGTPQWDFGARGIFLGLTLGSSRAQLARAVLEGIAQRGADLLDALEADTGRSVETLRVDGGLTDNRLFLQALADAIGRPVEVSAQREATTLGAAYLAGIATGLWEGTRELAALWRPRTRVEPARATDRDAWRVALGRACATIPELSALRF